MKANAVGSASHKRAPVSSSTAQSPPLPPRMSTGRAPAVASALGTHAAQFQQPAAAAMRVASGIGAVAPLQSKAASPGKLPPLGTYSTPAEVTHGWLLSQGTASCSGARRLSGSPGPATVTFAGKPGTAEPATVSDSSVTSEPGGIARGRATTTRTLPLLPSMPPASIVVVTGRRSGRDAAAPPAAVGGGSQEASRRTRLARASRTSWCGPASPPPRSSTCVQQQRQGGE